MSDETKLKPVAWRAIYDDMKPTDHWNDGAPNAASVAYYGPHNNASIQYAYAAPAAQAETMTDAEIRLLIEEQFSVHHGRLFDSIDVDELLAFARKLMERSR